MGEALAVLLERETPSIGRDHGRECRLAAELGRRAGSFLDYRSKSCCGEDDSRT